MKDALELFGAAALVLALMSPLLLAIGGEIAADLIRAWRGE